MAHPAGITVKTQAEILSEMTTAVRAALGPQVQTGPESVIGIILTICAAQMAQVYEQVLSLNDSLSPDSASGVQLDAVAALTGVVRDPAAPSLGVLTITGTPTTVVPAGSVYRVPAGPSFLTLSEVTIPGGGSIDVEIESTEDGDIYAAAGTITEQVTVVAGVDSVTNAIDTIAGRDTETDEQLRQRREAAISLIGAGTDGAIAARVGRIDSVEQVVVISNRTLEADAFGIPAKAFRCVVWPAQTDDAAVWQAIWEAAPAGIESDGAIAGTAVDQQGLTQAVAYAVATPVEVHIEVIVTTVASEYGGDDQVKEAVQTYTGSPTIGETLLLHGVLCAVTQAVAGILTIEVRAAVGGAPGPGDTSNVTIDPDEIWTVDPGDIVVTSS